MSSWRVQANTEPTLGFEDWGRTCIQYTERDNIPSRNGQCTQERQEKKPILEAKSESSDPDEQHGAGLLAAWTDPTSSQQSPGNTYENIWAPVPLVFTGNSVNFLKQN